MNPRPRRLSFSIDHSAQVCRCGWASRCEGEMMNDRRARSNPRKRVARVCSYAEFTDASLRAALYNNVARDRLFPGEILRWGFPPLEIYSRCHVERRLTPRDPSGVTPSAREILFFLDRYFGDTYVDWKINGIINV